MAYWECGCIVSLDADKEIRSATKLKAEICVVCETVPKHINLEIQWHINEDTKLKSDDLSNVIDLNMSDDDKKKKYQELVAKARKDRLRK